MAKIRLDLNQFKASGVYTIEYDASQTVVINTQTTRLVVGFSRFGPINAPVYCPDVKTARTIFGGIDKDLENKGSFFHRSLFTCLETGPCFALALMPLNDDVTTSNPDLSVYKSFSLSTTEANGTSVAELYSSYFNKERFYFPDTSYFLANVDKSTSPNIGKLLNFVNLGQTPFSIIVRKTGDLQGFNVTARDWFGAGNVPSFVREFDFISEYFVLVDIVAGDWTNLSNLSVDPTYSKYFDSTGLKIDQINNFLNSKYVTRIGSFQGSLIPDLVDNNGVNYSIDTIVNAAIATTGLFVALDREALADYDPASSSTVGRVDVIGDSLINNAVDTVNFLSYNFAAKEFFDYTQQTGFSVPNNTTTLQLGLGGASNLPAGLGSTGASYDPAVNGYNENIPTQVAYFTSYYGSGNSGKFNNVLNLRKEAFSAAQYAALLALKAGTSVALSSAAGATHYATISSSNEAIVGSDTRLQLGIAHPDKLYEGTTPGKNSQILSVSSPDIIVSGTLAASQINDGDWIFAENSGVRYYFRVVSSSVLGFDSLLTLDVTNAEFGGAVAIGNLTTFYTIYWESTSGVAGSLFDVLSSNVSSTSPLVVVKDPDAFDYVSGGAVNYYVGYEGSPAYKAFDTGILADGDRAFVAGPTPLYLSAAFGSDVDNISTVTITAFRDSSLTVGYTGAWDFTDMKTSTGATVTPTAIEIYSLIGDYSVSVGATGFNSSRTTCYIGASDASKINVGQYLVADPNATGDPSNYILTRVVSKKLVSTGTYATYYQINVNQRLADYTGSIVRYKRVEQVAPAVQFTYLSGFKVGTYHLPDGSNTQLAKILGMLDPANTNIPVALSSRHIIAFRYIVDTFDGGLNSQSYPKSIVTTLALNRQKCLAIMNAPSIKQFIASTDPRFTELPTNANPKPLLQTAYIAEGGNLSLGPSFTYSLPDEELGAKFSGFFSPFITLRENNKNFNVPPAADVSNNFIRKFINGQPYAIVAGPRRGVLSNPNMVGLEYDFTDADRANLEPFGWNPIVFRRGIGFMIFGNQSAFQTTPSAFNNLHVRDLLITIEEAIEDVLAGFLFEFNDASTRLQIKTIVDAFLDNVRSGGGIYDFETIMNETNNTQDVIDQNFAIIDVGVEPARGAQKFINRVTVLKTGTVSSGGFTAA